MNTFVAAVASLALVACLFVQFGSAQPVSGGDLRMLETGGYGSAGSSGLDDAIVDYMLNREAAERLRSSGSQFPTRFEMVKRNKYRLCSINAVACFGGRK